MNDENTILNPSESKAKHNPKGNYTKNIGPYILSKNK